MLWFLLIIQIYFFQRHYYADVDKTRREVERLIRKGEWDTKAFTKIKENLLKELQIKYNPFDNEVILEKLLESEKSYKKLEKLLEEIHAK